MPTRLASFLLVSFGKTCDTLERIRAWLMSANCRFALQSGRDEVAFCPFSPVRLKREGPQLIHSDESSCAWIFCRQYRWPTHNTFLKDRSGLTKESGKERLFSAIIPAGGLCLNIRSRDLLCHENRTGCLRLLFPVPINSAKKRKRHESV